MRPCSDSWNRDSSRTRPRTISCTSRAPPLKGSFLPYGRQGIDDADVDAVVAVLRSDWLTTGPAVGAFEQRLATSVDAADAVACSSGTAALHLSALALGIGPGDSVVVPAITFAATANACRYVGAEVVFADVKVDSGLLDLDWLERYLSSAEAAPRAVFPVHYAGQTVDMPRLTALARQHGFAVVEDACHALGGCYSGVASDEHIFVGSGRFSDLTVFSMHPVKIIAMGEGGAVTGQDAALLERVRLLVSHGITKSADRFVDVEEAFEADGSARPWHNEMVDLGFNYRASDIQCALATSQLTKLDDFVQRRTELVAAYTAFLDPYRERISTLSRTDAPRTGWHLLVARIDFQGAGVSRALLMRELARRGFGTQVHYIPVYRHPYYVRRYGRQQLSGAERFFERTLSLPLYPGMSELDVRKVVDELTACLGL